MQLCTTSLSKQANKTKQSENQDNGGAEQLH